MHQMVTFVWVLVCGYTEHMNHAYSSDEASQAYEQFLASEDGRIFRSLLGDAFLSHLEQGPLQEPAPTAVSILDAGCGDGWLVGRITSKQYNHITISGFGCDAGAPLIAHAKTQYPAVQFTVCDLSQPLPYEPEQFDVVCASMVLHDVADEAATLKNLAAVLKPNGRIIASIVNPYYGYPVGEWKRGLVGRLLGRTPTLRLARAYNELSRDHRPNFEWRPHLGSHFTPLSHHIASATAAGLALTHLTDLTSSQDSTTYNLTYQLHRFPIILLLEFSKK